MFWRLKIFLFLSVLLLPLDQASAESGGYLVKFHTDVSAISDTAHFREIGSGKRLYWVDDRNALAGLEQAIEYCETNDEIQLIGQTEPISLLTLDDAEETPWQLQMVRTGYAWEHETYGNQVRVAVIDSGCNAHLELEGRLAGGYNYTDPDKPEDYSDKLGHGTHVAGVIAAQLAGAAPMARIYALKCADKYQSAGTDILASAIYDAVDKYDCRIINMSLGIRQDKKTIRDAVQYAYEKGVILVAAAGNDGNGTIYYPAGYDEVIGVGSVGATKERSYFSQQNESVFVSAPGERVRGLKGTNGYTVMNGTSQAAPLVSGAAALILSADEDIDGKQWMELLKSTSEDLGDPGKDSSYGWGLLNIEKLMDAVMGEYYIAPIRDQKIFLYNQTDQTKNAVGILGLYEDQRLLSEQREILSLSPHTKTTIDYGNYEGEIRFFLWQSLENMKPFTKRRIGGE